MHWHALTETVNMARCWRLAVQGHSQSVIIQVHLPHTLLVWGCSPLSCMLLQVVGHRPPQLNTVQGRCALHAVEA